MTGMPQRIFLVSFLGFAFFSCVRRPLASLPSMEVNLFAGIEKLAKLGDNEEMVIKRTAWTKVKTIEVSIPDQREFGFSKILHIPDAGARVYLRYGYTSLILLQEPFHGNILGKKFKVFTFSIPGGNTWEEALVKELGAPTSKGDGGRFGSESLMYSWGDIAFNRMGPNELALYRDQTMAKFRQKNFGRVVQFFSQP